MQDRSGNLIYSLSSEIFNQPLRVVFNDGHISEHYILPRRADLNSIDSSFKCALYPSRVLFHKRPCEQRSVSNFCGA